jgi:hypothetical protein
MHPKPDGKRFVHYSYTLCSLRPTLKRRAYGTKPGKPGFQRSGMGAVFLYAWAPPRRLSYVSANEMRRVMSHAREIVTQRIGLSPASENGKA